MLNILSGVSKKKIIVYIILITAILAVFWQVNQFDFISIDDDVYVTDNHYIQSGITLDGLRWAFTTRYFDLWIPLVWLSYMLDYQVYGLYAGGYHLTNVFLHILSTLLLFWLFNRMTGSVWKSAFVAAFFALHPLRVESVTYIAERKDVLSLFFGILTLCFYVYYTEKPVMKRYLTVLFFFFCGLMSKPMVVTLPLVMIFLDYWPLRRFELKKASTILWQLREKAIFLVLSVMIGIITLYNPNSNSDPNMMVSLHSRIANATVALITYVEKIFWPNDPVVLFASTGQPPLWMILVSALLVFVISTFAMLSRKRLPYFFTGWFWYIITVVPVTGIIQIGLLGSRSISDRYTYLPSIGIGMMIAWGVPELMQKGNLRERILAPSGIIFLSLLAVLTFQKCSYWEDSFKLADHTLQITQHNNTAHAAAHLLRGRAYFRIALYPQALEDFNEVVLLIPNCADCYYNRGVTYSKLGQQSRAIEDYNKTIYLIPDFVYAYLQRGNAYTELGMKQRAIEDYHKVISYGFSPPR